MTITKTERFDEDILIADRNADIETQNDAACAANDAAGQAYQAYYEAHPGIGQLDDFVVDGDFITGLDPAVDAYIAAYREALGL